MGPVGQWRWLSRIVGRFAFLGSRSQVISAAKSFSTFHFSFAKMQRTLVSRICSLGAARSVVGGGLAPSSLGIRRCCLGQVPSSSVCVFSRTSQESMINGLFVTDQITFLLFLLAKEI